MSSATPSVLDSVPSSPPAQCVIEGLSLSKAPLFFGPQLFGNNSAWFLLGFLIAQTYTYYTQSANDHPIFKTIVYSMVFITVVESAAEGFVAYIFLIFDWGNPSLLSEAPFATQVLNDLQPLFDAIPAIFVQFYYTWRIWTFCMAVGGRAVKIVIAVICAFISLTSICAFISVILLTVVLLVGPAAAERISFSTIVLVWTISTVVADLTITACMMAILYHAKSTSYFGETRDRIARLLRLTIQTGFLTSILALPIAPLYLHSEEGIFTLTCYVLGISYAISLLANLNARNYRNYHTPPIVTEETVINSPDIPPIRPPSIAFTPGQNPGSKGVNTTTGGNGVLSSIRSVSLTIHNEPNEPIPTSIEYMSLLEAEVQQTAMAEEMADPLHESK